MKAVTTPGNTKHAGKKLKTRELRPGPFEFLFFSFRTCFFRPLFQLVVAMCLIVPICLALPCHAAYNDWAEGSQDAADGATRDYYNRAGRLEWDNYLGDWRDVDDVAQGASAYATADIDDNNTSPLH
jgi:hypothetical protein